MKKIAICSTMCILVMGASPAFSATIHVPADQPTIQAGVNAAASGDTVLVAPGVYYEADHAARAAHRCVLTRGN